MSSPEKQMDEHFRDKLEDLEINPPDRVWTVISGSLDRNEMSRERKRLAWLWWFSIISLIVSVGTFAIIAFRDNAVVAEDRSANIAGTGDGRQNNNNDDTYGSINLESDQSNGEGQDNNTASNSSTASANTNSYPNSNATANGSAAVSLPTYSASGKTSVKSTQNISYTHSQQDHMQKVQNSQHTAGAIDIDKSDNAVGKTASDNNSLQTLSSTFSAEEMLMESRKVILLPVEQQPMEIASVLRPLTDSVVPGKSKCPKWKAGVNYTYAWTTFRVLKDAKDSTGYYDGTNAYLERYRLAAAHFDSVETKKKGFSKGIALGYRVLPHFTIKTGVDVSYYQWDAHLADAVLTQDEHGNNTFAVTTSTSAYNTDTINDTAATDVFTILSTNFSVSPDTVLIQHKFKYASVPVIISYDVFNPCSRFGLSLNAGVAASFLQSYTVIHNGEQEGYHKHYMRKSSMELIAGAAFSYNPIRNLSIEVQPVYRRFIQPVNKFQTVKTYPYMWGIQTGLYFKF